MKTEQIENFEPVFLYKDDVAITRVTEQMKVGAPNLNAFISEVEATFKRTLTDDEKLKVKNEGIQWLINDHKKNFPFPDADDSFNYKAMGINLEPIKTKHLSQRSSWRFEFDFEGGEFKATTAAINKACEQYHYYTKNKRQNHALAYANELYDLIRRMQEEGFAITNGIGKINSITPLLHTTLRGKLEVRGKYIENL